jgi:hypothetical protein
MGLPYSYRMVVRRKRQICHVRSSNLITMDTERKMVVRGVHGKNSHKTHGRASGYSLQSHLMNSELFELVNRRIGRLATTIPEALSLITHSKKYGNENRCSADSWRAHDPLVKLSPDSRFGSY